MKMTNNYDQFKNILPYQSEMFGVYQPILGWKSKRVLDRFNATVPLNAAIEELSRYFDNATFAGAGAGSCEAGKLKVELGEFVREVPTLQQHSVLLQEIAKLLSTDPARSPEEWKAFVSKHSLSELINTEVFPVYQREFKVKCQALTQLHIAPASDSSIQYWLVNRLKFEGNMARIIYELVSSGLVEILNGVFYPDNTVNSKDAFWKGVKNIDQINQYKDPYLTFDPNKDIKDVSLSPLGIVHLFRQFFFEFDTFLGTPTGHVWLAPGSTVELIEISQRKVSTEKTVETSYESTIKTEASTTDQDELSDAIKKENQDNLKLGFSTTVNQSWPTGSASATGNINMDKTQQQARETTHKTMREQTQKLSAEIRENYKTTFKTVTESTDTSSKRYVLANTTDQLINYELRRKMRQVGVQVQDIGSYLCWETYVDDPGENLGLSNLLHIAKPADLNPLPPPSSLVDPAPKYVPFQVNLTWDFKDRQYNEVHADAGYEFIPMVTYQIPSPEDGYELAAEGYQRNIDHYLLPPDATAIPLSGAEQEYVASLRFIPVYQISGTGHKFHGIWAFTGMYTHNNQELRIGVHATENLGLGWDERVDFVVGGTLKFVPTAQKLKEVADARAANAATRNDASEANQQATNQAYLNAVKERVEFASNITKRKFEDLREEERIIVYRKLIGDLMTDQFYSSASSLATDRQPGADRDRHVMAELINSIFDVDKMLYFVAPEWWQPKERKQRYVGVNDLLVQNNSSVMSWGDNPVRPDNYLITEKSQPASMGSSLGWLLQLDGDDLRNAFLNAPWVKAVIPIRPGKEQAAVNWLKRSGSTGQGVEGTEGLDNHYAASAAELEEIRAMLLAADPNDAVSGHEEVTIEDAIRFLCLQVANKHDESVKTDIYPKGAEIDDSNKVSSTPIDKVYEYGFYPLQGSFRYNPADPDPNNPDANFQVFDQWVEILPTDQVVPVEVKYDPKTGRLL